MDGAGEIDRTAARRLVALVCAAQVLVQIGAFFWPALLPQLSPQWGLSNSGAGWITALMLLALIAFWWIRPRELAGDRGS